MNDLLTRLAPHAILVGSAARGARFNDIDLVVNQRGLALAKKLFPPGWVSAFIGNIKTYDTPIPIEVFTYWYGPDYRTLARRRGELTTVRLFDVPLRAWPTPTQ